MSPLKRAIQESPAWAAAGVLFILAFYFLPALTFYSFRPVLLLSEDAVRMFVAMTGPARERTTQRLITKNIQGVVFVEETLQDLESSGRAFVASGEELLRLFKLQSVASYYVFEQVRDKNLNPEGSYIFLSEAPLFERVFSELKVRLPPGAVIVYERGIFRGDAAFPDNFILESSLPPSTLRATPLGWPADRIRGTIEDLRARRGDTLWAVTWSDGRHAAAPITDTRIPVVAMPSGGLRFPYDSVRIVHDPGELISLPRSSDLAPLAALPKPPQNLPLALAMLVILAATLRLHPWISWSVLLAAGLLVLALALLPSQQVWVLQGVAALLPPAGLFSWMASADRFRSRLNRPLLETWTILKLSCLLILLVGSTGWLLSTLFWQFPESALRASSVYGLTAIPLAAAALFLSVWGIEVSHRPIYPRHLRTGLELALAGFILFQSTSAWILASSSGIAWARWMVLVERTRGRTLEDAPGNYAAFFAASALGLKLFLTGSPPSAAMLLAAAFAAGAMAAAAWLSRGARPA